MNDPTQRIPHCELAGIISPVIIGLPAARRAADERWKSRCKLLICMRFQGVLCIC